MPPRRGVLWALLALVSGYNLSTLLSHLEFPVTAPPTVKVIPKRSPVNPLALAQTWRHVSEDYTFPSAEEFGANAVNLVIEAYHSANAGPEETQAWIRKNVPGWTRAELRPEELRAHALHSLAGLGQTFPGRVDRFYYEQIRTTNRIPILHSMAASGARHFAFFTNLISRGTIHDQGHAIQALAAMGTNAHEAVPLVFSTLERHGANRDQTWWSGSLVLVKIGPRHARTVPGLLDQLSHSNDAAREMATLALAELTERQFQIRHEFIRLARMPITATNDPGEFTAQQLSQLRVPPEIGIPIMMKRLRYAVKLDGHLPDYNSQTCRWLSSISTYGTNALPAISYIEEQVLSRIPPERYHAPVGSRIWRIEQSFRRIDPAWQRRYPEIASK